MIDFLFNKLIVFSNEKKSLIVLVIWLSGYLVIWLSGYLVIWLSGYLVIWLSGYLVI
ncbi:hypothetical protein NA898_12100 [Proteus cibi]|uniref:Uncharacterized protein n=1 Tax=Proteus cibi TaxID=2050966 RepID=A0ABU6EFT3_9GAMM|nr:hypothetical protein [Proteus cibi]MEB6857937.1 hypothetical protein [Proteus cibi]MEB7089286.1 hypothetical protein [Proteus cibi]